MGNNCCSRGLLPPDNGGEPVKQYVKRLSKKDKKKGKKNVDAIVRDVIATESNVEQKEEVPRQERKKRGILKRFRDILLCRRREKEVEVVNSVGNDDAIAGPSTSKSWEDSFDFDGPAIGATTDTKEDYPANVVSDAPTDIEEEKQVSEESTAKEATIVPHERPDNRGMGDIHVLDTGKVSVEEAKEINVDVISMPVIMNVNEIRVGEANENVTAVDVPETTVDVPETTVDVPETNVDSEDICVDGEEIEDKSHEQECSDIAKSVVENAVSNAIAIADRVTQSHEIIVQSDEAVSLPNTAVQEICTNSIENDCVDAVKSIVQGVLLDVKATVLRDTPSDDSLPQSEEVISEEHSLTDDDAQSLVASSDVHDETCQSCKSENVSARCVTFADDPRRPEPAESSDLDSQIVSLIARAIARDTSTDGSVSAMRPRLARQDRAHQPVAVPLVTFDQRQERLVQSDTFATDEMRRQAVRIEPAAFRIEFERVAHAGFVDESRHIINLQGSISETSERRSLSSRRRWGVSPAAMDSLMTVMVNEASAQEQEPGPSHENGQPPRHANKRRGGCLHGASEPKKACLDNTSEEHTRETVSKGSEEPSPSKEAENRQSTSKVKDIQQDSERRTPKGVEVLDGQVPSTSRGDTWRQKTSAHNVSTEVRDRKKGKQPASRRGKIITKSWKQKLREMSDNSDEDSN